MASYLTDQQSNQLRHRADATSPAGFPHRRFPHRRFPSGVSPAAVSPGAPRPIFINYKKRRPPPPAAHSAFFINAAIPPRIAFPRFSFNQRFSPRSPRRGRFRLSPLNMRPLQDFLKRLRSRPPTRDVRNTAHSPHVRGDIAEFPPLRASWP